MSSQVELTENDELNRRRDDWTAADRITMFNGRFDEKRKSIRSLVILCGFDKRGGLSMIVTLEEAKAHLGELIQNLPLGQEVVITIDQTPVAKLIGQTGTNLKPRIPGNCQGMITLAVEDDEHLRDFAEYMP